MGNLGTEEGGKYRAGIEEDEDGHRLQEEKRDVRRCYARPLSKWSSIIYTS